MHTVKRVFADRPFYDFEPWWSVFLIIAVLGNLEFLKAGSMMHEGCTQPLVVHIFVVRDRKPLPPVRYFQRLQTNFNDAFICQRKPVCFLGFVARLATYLEYLRSDFWILDHSVQEQVGSSGKDVYESMKIEPGVHEGMHSLVDKREAYGISGFDYIFGVFW